ncbi:hypothetical protein BDQ17DRAFT_1550007 [Cyathus striatus]|nr:hypothetical protein BDQ17DRAFT_1550007 [Cyathus striatus]
MAVVYCICSHPLEKTQKGAIWDPPKEAGEEWVREEKGKGEEEEGEGKTVLLDGDDRDMAVSCRIELMLMQNRAGVEMAVRAHSGEHCLCLVKPAITNDAVAPAPAGAAGLPPGFQPVGPQTPNPPANNANAIANQLQLHFPTIPAPVPLAPLTNLAPNTCPLTRLRCMEIISSWDVVGFLDFHADNRPVFVGGLCPPCREVFKRECERLAGEMWDALPRLCGLEGWDVLESKRRGAVSF